VAVRFGAFALAADSRRLTRSGENLHLTPKAFDLLRLLVEAAPRVVTKTELHERLWPDSFVADATLVGLVKEVRRVLADSDAAAPIIRTVSRVGYAFAATLHPEASPDAGSRHWLVADGRSFALEPGGNDVGREPAAAVRLAEPIALRDGDRLVIGAVPLTYRTSAAALSTETRASTNHALRTLNRQG
jgi:DNA-binding winged helix-turn-helix (wHTH) protein